MGLQERAGGKPDEIHGKGRIRIQQDKVPEESNVVRCRSVQHAKPMLPVRFPGSQPFMELFFRDIKALTELFDGMETGEIFPRNKEDEEQAAAGIRDDDIRKDSMSMFTAVTEYTHNAEILFLFPAGSKVNDGSAIVVMDMTVSGAATDGTCFQTGLKLLHVGVKKRF